MIVVSRRLYLRDVSLEDTDAFFALDRDPEVMRYIGDGSVTTDPEVTRAGLGRVVAAQGKRPGLGLWACCRQVDGSCLGWFQLKTCMLSLPKDALEVPAAATEHIELGYRLRRDAWNQGYATEMALELLRHGFHLHGLEQIVAVCKPENAASIRVMLKAGLSHRGAGVYRGVPVDVYGATRAAWRPPSA